MVNFLILFSTLLAFGAVSTSDRALVERGNNLLRNGGFEGGKVEWTASGGTFTTTTTAANLGKGSLSGSFDSSSASQTLTSTAVAIPAGLYGRNGVASCIIQGAGATHTIQAYDGTNILASQTINSQSNYTRSSVNFIFPSSGNISLRVVSVASDEPAIYIDDCFLGDADGFNVSQVSQAQFIGAVKITGCSAAWSTTSTSYANFSAGTSCSYSTSGNALAPSTNIPGIRFTSLPPGEYMLVYEGLVVKDGSVNTIGLRFNDGTNSSREESFYKNNAGSNEGGQSGFTQSINYSTSQSNITLQIQAKVSANNGYIHGTTANPGVIRVYRFPSSSEISYRPEQANAYGVGKYNGVTNCSWSTTSGSYADFAADADCNSTTVLGSATSVGDTEPEFNFNNIPAGTYKVTATGLFSASYSASSTECLFRLYDGTNQIGVIGANAFSGSGTGYASGITGYVSYSSQQATTKIRVQGYRTTGGGSCVIGNAGSSVDFQIILEPISNVINAPILAGSVTSNSSGQERIERAQIDGGASDATPCSSTPCNIRTQSGSWLSSVSRNSTGDYTLNIATGIFSAKPSCNVTLTGGTDLVKNSGQSATATSYNIKTYNTGGTISDSSWNVTCQGPR